MKYSEAKQGRTFVIRLEDGDVIHEVIEDFARKKNISRASLIILGGIDKDSILISGPKNGRAKNIIPMEMILDNVHEITGTGTIFPNESGSPILHMHIACGRKDSVIAGCIRKGVKTWLVIEIILTELLESTANRKLDPKSGFELLAP